MLRTPSSLRTLVALALLCLLSAVGSNPAAKKKLLYIMLDGFRHDYLDDQPAEALPGFSRLLDTGVRAEYLSSVFPSISYPAWTTLVTGLWPESHGIVGNYFYDQEEKDVFSLFDHESTGKKKWWTAEPIWTTATKEGVSTGVIHWSRCDVPFDNLIPHHCEPYAWIRGTEIFRKNMEKALAMLLEQDFDFLQLYNGHMDDIGHDFGPETEARKKAVRELDETILYMLNRIQEAAFQVNIVIVSDHGMVTTSEGSVRRVELDDYLPSNRVESVAESGAFSNIKVEAGYVDQVHEELKRMPGVEVFRRNEIPEELHLKNGKYIHDIVLKADINTFLMSSRSASMLPPRDESNYVLNGSHGFDPREEKMRAIFFASGPDFETGLRIPPVQSVDVYPLLARLLGVAPLPNNGTFDHIKMALKDQTPPLPPPPPPTSAGNSIKIGGGFGATALSIGLTYLGAVRRRSIFN